MAWLVNKWLQKPWKKKEFVGGGGGVGLRLMLRETGYDQIGSVVENGSD